MFWLICHSKLNPTKFNGGTIFSKCDVKIFIRHLKFKSYKVLEFEHFSVIYVSKVEIKKLKKN